MSEITKQFSVPFGDELKKILKQSSRTAVMPLILANKTAIQECLDLQFSLKSIYDAWMAHQGSREPIFSYTAFRRACIRAGLYQTKIVDRSPNLEPTDLDSALTASVSAPVPNTKPSEIENIQETPAPITARPVTEPDRPKRKLVIVHKASPIEDLPDNTIPTFSNAKKVD